MGRNLSEGPRYQFKSLKRASGPQRIDILEQASEVAANAFRQGLIPEIDKAERRADVCGCRNCRGDVIAIFDRINDTLSPVKGTLKESGLRGEDQSLSQDTRIITVEPHLIGTEEDGYPD